MQRLLRQLRSTILINTERVGARLMSAPDGVLQAVLSGHWPVPAALEWALSSSSQPPPLALCHRGTQQAAEPDLLGGVPLTPAAFRDSILSQVRDEAEIILAAAEAEARRDRHVPASPGGHRDGAQGSALAAAPGAPPGQKDSNMKSQQLERVARRLEVPHVDDLNFPALGAAPAAVPAATAPTGAAAGPWQGKPRAAPLVRQAATGGGRRLQPAALAGVASHGKGEAGRAGGGSGGGGGAPRRRIVPTMVPIGAASDSFAHAEVADKPQRLLPDVPSALTTPTRKLGGLF